MRNQFFFGSLGNSNSIVYDGYGILELAQSNGVPRFNKEGNLPIEQQGVFPFAKNYNYNGGTPDWTNYQSSVNDNWGNDIIVQNPLQTLDGYNNAPNTFAKGNQLAWTNWYTYGKETWFIPCAYGGTGLDPFFMDGVYLKGCWHPSIRDSFFDLAINMITNAWNAIPVNKKIYPIIIWDQGETDATVIAGLNYYDNLVAFEAALRLALSDLSPLFLTCPFIVNSKRPSINATGIFPYIDDVQRAEVRFVSETPNAHMHYNFTARTPVSSDYNHDNPIVDNFVGVMSAINCGEDYAHMIDLLMNPIVDNYIQLIGGELIPDIITDHHCNDFKTHGILEVLSVPTGKKLDYVIRVGAGGSGGASGAGTSPGAGGGGGVDPTTDEIITIGKHPIYIGLGGEQTATDVPYNGNNGGNTTFNGRTAIGGGYGGGYDNSVAASGGPGGSGGSSGNYHDGVSGALGTPPQGNNGGLSLTYPSFPGGAGGAGGAGQDGTVLKPGKGGPGYLWVDGEKYGPGGGGASHSALADQGLGGDSIDENGFSNGQVRGVFPATQGEDGKGGGSGGTSAVGDPGTAPRGGHGRVRIIRKYRN